MIELSNLNYRVKDLDIISNFNYKFEKGKCYGLIGSSGCGKTTLIKLISGILTKTSGNISYNYFDNSESKTIPNYPNLTAVFQDFKLFPNLSIYENIVLPIKAIGSIIDDKIINEICTLFNVSAILKNKPYEISTGQRQRVAFIRAVLLKPKILLLDEITSALDIESVQILTRYLNKLKNEETTLIIATHSISFCKNICDDYLFIDNGQLNSFGSVVDFENSSDEIISDRLKTFLTSY
jgi:ABC-type multidrug transport system ATPase subunit